MLNRLTHHWPHYFQRHLGRQLEELYVSVGLQDLALAAMIIFEPIFLHQLGYSIAHIALYYSLVYFLYIFLVPFGGKMVARKGPQRSIALSTIFLVLYYVSLLQIPNFPALFWIAPFLFALQKTFYWPGYHADFIATSSQGQRGKELSGLYTVSTLMYIIGPLLGGMVIKLFGYQALFLIGAGIIFLSNVPLFIDRSTVTPQSFSYWESFRLPWTRRHRRSTIAYFGFGEQLISMYLWPIFLTITFKTALDLGAVAAATTFLTAVTTLVVGRMIDSGRWRMTLRAGTLMTVINWVARPFLRSGPALFLSDMFGRIGSNLTWVTSSEVTYERAIAQNDPIRRAILLEQGLAYGKALVALLIAFLALWFPPFTAAFVLSAAFSLLYFIFR